MFHSPLVIFSLISLYSPSSRYILPPLLALSFSSSGLLSSRPIPLTFSPSVSPPFSSPFFPSLKWTLSHPHLTPLTTSPSLPPTSSTTKIWTSYWLLHGKSSRQWVEPFFSITNLSSNQLVNFFLASPAQSQRNPRRIQSKRGWWPRDVIAYAQSKKCRRPGLSLLQSLCLS